MLLADLVPGMSAHDWLIVIGAWSLIPGCFVLRAILGGRRG